MLPPNCSKCGKDHFNFVKCGAEKTLKERPAPITITRPREDGFVKWGDKLHTLKRHGTSLRQKDRVYARSMGVMTPPTGWTPPEERK